MSAPRVSAPWVSAPWVSAPWVSAPWVSAPWVSAPWVSALRGRRAGRRLPALALAACLAPAAAAGQDGAGADVRAPGVFPASPVPAPPAPSDSPPAGDAFATCLSELHRAALAGGVPRGVVEAALAGLSPDPEVLAAAGGQSEFAATLWAYLDAAVSEARVAEGRRRVAALAPVLDAIEARYGVDRHVLVAVWGVESSYGAVLDDPRVVKPVVRSLATLACADAARGAYWRGELVAALAIRAAGEAPLDRLPGGRLTGSWAGAMGHTQFMPSVYRAHAVDFDGDGRRDIWTSAPDALASTAAYLAAAGWRAGERWGYEAALPEGFDPALADETIARGLEAWRALGVRPVREPAAEGAAGATKATLHLPAGVRGPAVLLLPNFAALLRYNTAFAYALSVGHLADRLRGEPGFTRDWPRGDRALTAGERRDLQAGLAARGLPVGAVDGKVGPRTRAAIRAFQGAAGLPADGYADAALLERLRAGP